MTRVRVTKNRRKIESLCGKTDVFLGREVT
jgi:hypothetical protein